MKTSLKNTQDKNLDFHNPFFFDSFDLEYRYMFLPLNGVGEYRPITDEWASGHPRLQYNRANKFLRYIIIDCDNNDFIDILENENTILKPNYIIQNKNKAGGHLFFILEKPILKSKSFEYFSKRFFHIYKMLTEFYNGDKLAKGYIGKNYLNKWDFNHFVLNPQMFSLEDLEKNLPAIEKKQIHILPTSNDKIFRIGKVELKLNVSIGTRNISLFNQLRKYAYIVKSSNDLFSLLENQSVQINESFESPLPLSEVKATVRSIFKYFNSKDFKEIKKVGVMDLDDDLTKHQKQSLGAEYSAKVKKTKTIVKIEIAIKELKMRNQKITKSAIADISKLSLKTIQRNWKNI